MVLDLIVFLGFILVPGLLISIFVIQFRRWWLKFMGIERIKRTVHFLVTAVALVAVVMAVVVATNPTSDSNNPALSPLS